MSGREAGRLPASARSRLGLGLAGLGLALWATSASFAAAPASAPASSVCGGFGFADVAAAAGIAFRHDTGAAGGKHLPETMGAGLAWLDYDGDGWLDLYLVQSGPFPPPVGGSAAATDRLWRNLGDGTFEEVAATSGVGEMDAREVGYGQGAVAADLDGDGDSDLYVTQYGLDLLWLNQGDGRFERQPSGVDGWSSSAALADADGDGDLDLYVTRYVVYDPAAELFCGDVEAGERTYCDPSLFAGAVDRFLRNEGGGRFVDATEAAGLAGSDGRGLGVLFTDLDGDGDGDLYVANDLTLNGLYRNRGDGTFEDHSLLSGAAVNRDGKPEAGMGLAVGDLDGDGLPELGVTNFDVETNTLYRNLGDMQFEDVSVPSGFGLPSFNLLGFGLALDDFDLDGDLDFYAANGHIFENPRRADSSHAQTDLLLLGDGRGRFTSARCGPAFETALVGRGLAVADYDNDGDADLGISNSNGPFQLLANSAVTSPAETGWVGVRLVGRAPNTEAVGARVTLVTAAGRQSRWVVAGDSYQSSSERRMRFGMLAGDAGAVLEVRWPDGRVQRVLGAPLGRYLTLRQP